MPRNPEDIHQTFAQAVSNGDLTALIALYEPHAVVIEQNGARTEGIENIRQHLEQLLAAQPKMTIQGSRAHRLGDLAVLSSHWTAEASTPDGKPVHLEFHGSELARRQPDGTWRLILDNPWGAA